MKLSKKIVYLLMMLFLLTAIGLYAQTATAPSVGNGSEGSPYEIATLDNLYWLSHTSSEWDKHYIQVANIDATTSATWGLACFSPIGTEDNPFTGSYDGKGFVIDKLCINRPEDGFDGLFGAIKNSRIDSLGMVNVNISGTWHTGGVVGYAEASVINNCYVSGTIKSASSRVGGLAGAISASVVEKCYSTASVTGGKHSAGGLIGRLINASKVKNCYSTGDVEGVVNRCRLGTGGLIGYAGTDAGSSEVENCYSTGNVNVTIGYVGGFIGFSEADVIITNCYSTGSVVANQAKEQLDGFARAGVVTNCFWDKGKSGITTSRKGTGKTSAEMQSQSTFTGWDFADIWKMDSYPTLKWQIPTDIEADEILPKEYSLEQNYPNPFNPTTVISFDLLKQSDVKLIVYNALGEKVTELVNGTLSAGNHKVNFNATNLATGMYIYKITAGDFVSVKKMMLLK